MVETMDELIARVQGQLNRIQDLGDSLNGIEVTETSPDGAVTVTVDGSATLLDLRFTEAIRQMTPDEFESALVGTARAAAARAFGEQAELVEAFNAEQGG
ncbi:YbaB/EbfC family nucleoid-associated protein [Nocardia sp. BMG51109]|uniref:YbaB/EbfC family nucleoid-associated protein n=1 Tax=Nocardia sp. BMG51109 TaxID=1056816 RepID=UPI000463D827|nr:YbaB/EbfC family nucleoid-associated protein [Nocardia sp. BMG51109]